MEGLRIVCPPEKRVDIDGVEHLLRPLRMRDLVELLSLIEGMQAEGGEREASDYGRMIRGSVEAMGLILRRSFPSVSDWDRIGAEQEAALLEFAVTEGNLAEAIRSFGTAAVRLTRAMTDQAR